MRHKTAQIRLSVPEWLVQWYALHFGADSLINLILKWGALFFGAKMKWLFLAYTETFRELFETFQLVFV